MRSAVRAWCVVAALAFSAAGPGALVALGDDGPSRSAPTDRPTRSVLRPTEISAAKAPKQSDKIVILLVSGIGSDAQDGTFDPLIAALDDDPRFEIHRFGADPRHPYDTTGSVTANADQLAAEVRELAKTHPGIEIVAHSMGGVVVDAAFARGLSRDDKVTDYVALASPHAGSTPAIAGQPLLHIADAIGIGPELRAITAEVAQNAGSPAVHDLAHVQNAAPPRGVARADFRVVTDLVVPIQDTATPGVTSRSLLPTTLGAIEGHGGVTRDPRAIAVVTATLAHGTPPARTWTDMILESAAAQAWAPIDLAAPIAYAALAGLFFSCAFCLALYRRVRAIRGLRV